MPVTDYTQMASQMFSAEGTVDLAAADRLWTAVLSEPQIFLLMSPSSAPDGVPSAQLIDDKVWILAFTDQEKLKHYAARNKNLDEEGNALFLELSPAQVIELAKAMQHTNVFGFRFNEGQEHGWFIGFSDFLRIPEYLREKNLID